jgi:hypothetical protein
VPRLSDQSGPCIIHNGRIDRGRIEPRRVGWPLGRAPGHWGGGEGKGGPRPRRRGEVRLKGRGGSVGPFGGAVHGRAPHMSLAFPMFPSRCQPTGRQVLTCAEPSHEAYLSIVPAGTHREREGTRRAGKGGGWTSSRPPLLRAPDVRPWIYRPRRFIASQPLALLPHSCRRGITCLHGGSMPYKGPFEARRCPSVFYSFDTGSK